MMPPVAIRILRYRIVSSLVHPKLSFATGVNRLKSPIINNLMAMMRNFYSRFHHDEGAEECEEDVDCD